MKKKDKKKLSVTTALLWRIGALLLAVWAVSMALITSLTARRVCEGFNTEFWRDVNALPRWVRIDENLGDSCYNFLSYYEELDHVWVSPEFNMTDASSTDYYEYTMILQASQDEQPVLVGDGDYLVVYYNDVSSGEETWTYIDLQETAFGRELIPKAMEQALGYEEPLEDFEGQISWSDYSNLQYEGWIGYFEGMQFHLTAVVDYPAYVIPHPEPEPEWITTVAEPEPGQETVMIYPDLYNMKFHHGAHKPVTDVTGTEYDSLSDMIMAVPNPWYPQKLTDTVFFSTVYLEGEDGLRYQVSIAMRCQPLQYTLACIWPLYIWSLIPLIVAMLLLRWRIRRELTLPMAEIVRQGQKDVAALYEPPTLRWKESSQLQQGYIQLQQRFQELKKENTQLRTALDYAKDAEENRKQMISSISHELKTPLAIIHSYAEGLNEGIAKEKQGQYLDVILEETERMDAMVLEMLDHSRLEAGKVRLSSDQFSLGKQVTRIFETLRPVAEARGLKIQFQTVDVSLITADEARICQVITNLASNAIRYSADAGTIWVNVYQHENKTHFTVENQCEPLSEEALEKIWDTFYRADSARSAKGTGLGLPIVKSIVELHGGTCSAQNTQLGMIFHVTLP